MGECKYIVGGLCKNTDSPIFDEPCPLPAVGVDYGEGVCRYEETRATKEQEDNVSKYADLRWKIADLEKELEKRDIFEEELVGLLCKQARKIDVKDAEIEELKALLDGSKNN